MPSNADPNPDDDRGEAVRQSVRRLPGSAREVIVLHYFSGLTHEQISTALGISPQAVHGRLIRARRKIAEDLRLSGLVRRKI
jgi:RNA polymerase sigma-70 factor (ECF subfamily)